MLKIGYKIKTLRKQKNMTLKDLSKKMNLSISFLSGIERDVYSPSLETVLSISNIFRTTVAELLGESNKNKVKVIKKNNAHTFLTEDKKVKMVFLSKPVTIDTKLELKTIEVKPMYENKEFYHEHRGEEVVHVMDGVICMNVGGHVFELKRGDTVHFDSSILHGFGNRRNKSAKILIATSPPKLTPSNVQLKKYN